MRTLASCFVSLVVLVSGCASTGSDDVADLDAGRPVRPDTGSNSHSGNEPNEDKIPDASVLGDSSVRDDGGIHLDADLGSDGRDRSDVGTAPDASGATDSGAHPDTGIAPDATDSSTKLKWAGVRSSSYGIGTPYPSTEHWTSAIKTMAGYFPGSTPSAVI